MHCAKINSALCCINGALRITHNVQRSLLSWATVIKPHDALGESGLYIFHSEMAIASADSGRVHVSLSPWGDKHHSRFSVRRLKDHISWMNLYEDDSSLGCG